MSADNKDHLSTADLIWVMSIIALVIIGIGTVLYVAGDLVHAIAKGV